jgi:hypothetical protein
VNHQPPAKDQVKEADVKVKIFESFRQISITKKRIDMNQQNANAALQTLFAWSKVADGELSDEFIADKDQWTETHRNIITVAEWLYAV